ncbi:hypothetical protein THAR02_08738 [Trichoderma harzianum]|uniref:Uncharacterized protein n=1 Tax=Trichoderma harzianum TaxID=5544 RepID=A0A0G0A1H7_TRIHA|nr:hypothetical protein THAR02_08738 [Trichoderma harzianum]
MKASGLGITAKILKADDGMLSSWPLYCSVHVRAWAAVKCGRSEAVRWPVCVHACHARVPEAWGDQWHCAAATADADAAAPPCHAHEKHGRGPMESRQSQAGQGEAAIGHEGWPQRLFLAVQASQIPSKRWGGRGSEVSAWPRR